MSHAVPFNLLAFHASGSADPVATRLKWPLAGSLAIHVVVLFALVGLRFAPSLERPSGAYQVVLVTLPEISPPQPARPRVPERVTDSLVGALESVVVPKPRAMTLPQKSAPAVPAPLPLLPVVADPKPVSKQNVGKVPPPPRAEAGEASQPERVTDSLVGALESVVVPKPRAMTLPQKSAPAVPAPLPLLPVVADPKPVSKQNVGKVPPPPRAEAGEASQPERVMDSLVGALESVVVPKPQAPALPKKAAPVSAPPSPLRPLPALEMETQTIQAPPQPPQLASGPETGKSKMSTPPPSVGPLAQTLKQAVGTIVVPKKQKQASRRVAVSPTTVEFDSEQKQDTIKIPRSSGITLPSQAPRLAAVTPLSQKEETPVQTAEKSPTAESLTQVIQGIRIPESSKKSQPSEIVSRAVLLLPEASPKHPTAAEARDLHHTVVPPQAPPLAKVPIEQEPVPSQTMLPMTTSKSEPDTLTRKINALHIPPGQAFEAGQPGSRQTESGTQETLTDLRVAGSSPKEKAYWGKVENKIDERWLVYRLEFQRRQPLQVVLGFRVERNGQVTEPTVVRSSENKYFDLAAKRAVVAATPLPPFPETMPPFRNVQHTFTGPSN